MIWEAAVLFFIGSLTLLLAVGLWLMFGGGGWPKWRPPEDVPPRPDRDVWDNDPLYLPDEWVTDEEKTWHADTSTAGVRSGTTVSQG